MKNKFRRQIMAAVLSLTLAAGSICPGTVVYASPNEQAEEEVTVSQNDVELEDAGDILEQPPMEDAIEVSDDIIWQENQEAFVLESGALEYAYVQEAYMENADTPNQVMIKLSDDIDMNKVQNPSLVLNRENGQQTIVPVSGTEGGALFFAVNGYALENDIYHVYGLQYEDEQQNMNCLEIASIPGMEETAFGVGKEITVSDDYIKISPDTEELASEGMADSDNLEDNLVVNSETDMDALSSQISNRLAKADALMNAQDEISAERAVAGSVVVFLDPGHDQSHCGARANGLIEEDLNLRVAQYCKEYLESTYTNVIVHMSRSTPACPHPGTDSGTDNRSRVADAHAVGADCYVAIHFNSAAASSRGAMVFYPNPNGNATVNAQGKLLSTKIIEQLVSLGLFNNGIKIRNSEAGDRFDDGTLMDYYAVIRAAKVVGIPGIIIEHAFLTNTSDAAFCHSEENVKKLGIADAIGIANAYNLSTEPFEYKADKVQVTDIDSANGSFKISLVGASPVERIGSVKFNVYPTSDTSASYMYEAGLEDKKKGIYSVVGGVGNHDMTVGQYKAVAYIYDAAGRKTKVGSTTFTIEAGKLDLSTINVTAKVDKKETKTTLTLFNNPGAAKVYFKVYPKDKGSGSQKTFVAKKQSNGSWVAEVETKKFKVSGQYVVNAYTKDFYGNAKKVKTLEYTVLGANLKEIIVKKIDFNKGKFRVVASKLKAAAGLKDVKFTVKNMSGKKVTKTYSITKKSGAYFKDIDMKDFGYALGKYQITVSATDKNDTKTEETLIYNFVYPSTAISAKLNKDQTKITMTGTNLGIAAAVKEVKFVVKADGKSKSYIAKKSGQSYKYTMKVSDFGVSATYRVDTYVKNLSGSFVKVGDSQRVYVDDIEGGKISTKIKSKGNYLYVDSISSNSMVDKVEFKVWPLNYTSNSYTYKATEVDDGIYRVLVSPKKHANKSGTYKYRVDVTLENGVSKRLLSGKFEIGKDQIDKEEDPADASGYYAITGANGVTVDQLVAYYKAHASYPSYYNNSDATTIKKFCTLYYQECAAENIKVEVAFAQAMKETNFLRYTGDVDIAQYNFAGIGATGGGAKGNSFSSVAVGIRAQIQHLKAYANYSPLNKACVDPRFIYVQRGTAPYVQWLGIPDNPYGKGWATAYNYGSSIIQMISEIKSY